MLAVLTLIGTAFRWLVFNLPTVLALAKSVMDFVEQQRVRAETEAKTRAQSKADAKLDADLTAIGKDFREDDK